MSEPEIRFADDRYCFVCGEKNTSGLRLSPEAENGLSRIEWNPEKRFQGYRGILHGGLVMALMDEAMAYAAISLVGPAATATINARFRSPVSTEMPLEVRGCVTKHSGRKLHTQAEMKQDGKVRATAEAVFVKVAGQHY